MLWDLAITREALKLGFESGSGLFLFKEDAIYLVKFSSFFILRAFSKHNVFKL